MITVLITGTNTGIGFEFAKQYAIDGYKVFATYLASAPKKELKKLAKKFPNIHLFPMDVTNEKQIRNVAQKLKNEKIDILINNAGIWGKDNQDLKAVTKKSMLDVYAVNAVGPLLVSKHFINHVLKSKLKTIVSISSILSCISENELNSDFGGNIYEYRSAKTALNMISKSLYVDFYNKGIKILLLHPGWVKTKIGGPNAQVDTYTSVSGMKKVIMSQPSSLKQFFYTYQGEPLAW